MPAKDDYAHWQNADSVILTRINRLIADIRRHPYIGIGNPESLKFEKSGYWSRRINREHRLVYKVVDKKIYVVQCRYHY